MKAKSKLRATKSGGKRTRVHRIGNESTRTESSDSPRVTCPVDGCKAGDFDYAGLSKHFAVVHGRVLTPLESKQLLASGEKRVPKTAKKLPKLDLYRKRRTPIEGWVRCDFCGVRRQCWNFKNTSRGAVVLCAKCIQRLNPTSSDLMDALRRLHGSYEGRPMPPRNK